MKKEVPKPLFVAEISANHMGSLTRARNLIHAAIDSGADAVKLQTYTADTMTLNIDSNEFKVSESHELWPGKKLYDLYKEAHTPWEWHEELFEICEKNGVIAFSTPFDSTAVDFLESLEVPMYKISSMETGDLPLIEKVASLGKPLLISTGATTFREIEDVVRTVRNSKNSKLTLLVCTSAYPAKPKDANLGRLKLLKEVFDVDVGLSDHTLGIGVSLAAIALGATVIEKHFTLSRSDGGADSAFSLEPEEFEMLVTEGNAAFESIGEQKWSISDSESESRRLRRSLYIVRDVSKGETVTKENVKAIRPGNGCEPMHLDSLLGKRFLFDAKIGTPMNLNLVSD
jgi:N-acetylneuraminate synthase